MDLAMMFSGAGFEILDFLLPLLVSVVTLALVALAKRLVDKMGIERSERIDTMLDKYIGIGVHAAQRFATKKLEGRTLDSKDKLALATNTVLAELKQSGLKNIGEELIKARIENFLEEKDSDSKLTGN